MKKILFVFGFLCLLAMVATPAMAETIIVDVSIDGLEDVDLGAFDFDLNYDAEKLTFVYYDLNDGLGSFTLWDAEDLSSGDGYSGIDYVGAGTVHLAAVSYLSDLSAQPDAFSLATLVFSTDAAGSSSVYDDFSLSNIDLGDADGNPISFSVETDGTSLTINAIPIPAGVWLLGSGLFGLFALRRQRRA